MFLKASQKNHFFSIICACHYFVGRFGLSVIKTNLKPELLGLRSIFLLLSQEIAGLVFSAPTLNQVYIEMLQL